MGLAGLVATVALRVGWIVFARDHHQRVTAGLLLVALGCAVVAGLAHTRLLPPWGTVVYVACVLGMLAFLGWTGAGEERAHRRG